MCNNVVKSYVTVRGQEWCLCQPFESKFGLLWPLPLISWHQSWSFHALAPLIIIIIIIISTTMFMVLSSWQSHWESSPGLFDECRMALSGRRPKTKPDDLGCESACTGCQKLHPPSPFIITQYCILSLVAERKADEQLLVFVAAIVLSICKCSLTSGNS